MIDLIKLFKFWVIMRFKRCKYFFLVYICFWVKLIYKYKCKFKYFLKIWLVMDDNKWFLIYYIFIKFISMLRLENMNCVFFLECLNGKMSKILVSF